MLSQYAALEHGLDDRAVHDAVLGDFDPDEVGPAAATPESTDYSTDYRTDFVSDYITDADADA